MAYRQNFGGNYESTFNQNNLGMSSASRNFNKPSFRCILRLMQTILKNMELTDKLNLCFKTKGTSSDRRDKSLKLI